MNCLECGQPLTNNICEGCESEKELPMSTEANTIALEQAYETIQELDPLTFKRLKTLREENFLITKTSEEKQ